MKKAAIGIDVGGTNIDFGIVTVEGELLKYWSEATQLSNKGQDIPDQIIASLEEQVYEAPALENVELIGVGLCAPGFVDEEKGLIAGAYNLGWEESILIREPIEAAFHLPVVLENDALLAAYGEQWTGRGQKLSSMVLVTLGTGVGGGIVINSELVKGTAGSAGEVGHIFVQEGGYLCTCGNHGCLETVASGKGMVRLAQDQYASYKKSSKLIEKLKTRQSLKASDIFEHAESGDPFAQEIVSQFTEYLGRGLSHIGNILNPDKILLGGGVSQAGEKLVEETKKAFDKHVYPNVRNTTQIELAALTNRAGVVGAARYLFQQLNLL